MVAKLTVIFFILLFLLAGITLILVPWMNYGNYGDWGDNYLLAFVAQKTSLPILQTAVASGWIRGAVTGLGILNLFLGFWEIAHFTENVRTLEEEVNEINSPQLKHKSKVKVESGEF